MSAEIVKQVEAQIARGDRNGALRRLADMVRQDTKNAELWYLIATATDDRDKQIRALNNALKIEPYHVRAAALRDALVPPNRTSAPNPPPLIQPQSQSIAAEEIPTWALWITWILWVFFWLALAWAAYGVYQVAQTIAMMIHDQQVPTTDSLGGLGTIIRNSQLSYGMSVWVLPGLFLALIFAYISGRIWDRYTFYMPNIKESISRTSSANSLQQRTRVVLVALLVLLLLAIALLSALGIRTQAEMNATATGQVVWATFYSQGTAMVAQATADALRRGDTPRPSVTETPEKYVHFGGWTIATEVSPINDSKTVSIWRRDYESEQASYALSTMYLEFNCEEGKLSALVWGTEFLDIASDGLIKVRFDNYPAEDQTMIPRSTSALFPQPKDILKKLMAHNRFALQIPRAYGEPLELMFDVTGLAGAAAPLLELCPL